MPVKAKLKFTKGGLKDKEICYDQKACVIIGRLNDSNIVIPETDRTVSRYHCILDITLPTVKVRDFGSTNGTFLNGEIIGQRDESLSVEEGRKQKSVEFSMKSGDRLGLGPDCEIVLDIELPQYCADCYCEIDRPKYVNADRQPICDNCHAKAEEQRKKEEAAMLAAKKAEEARRIAEEEARLLAERERLAKENEERRKAAEARRIAEQKAKEAEERQKKEEERRKQLEKERKDEEARIAAEKAKRNNPRCAICGAAVSASVPICDKCKDDPLKVMEYAFLMAVKKVDDAQQIAGYKNIKELGRGGMGVVWLVEELKNGDKWAMKLMLPTAKPDDTAKKMFLREARNACQLKHPNIVLHDKSGRAGNVYFILMEFCPGGSVDHLMKKYGGNLDINMATHIIFQVLDGLHHAHHAPVVSLLANGCSKDVKGIVHRDLKPANIFLMDTSTRPVAKIADFGLAKAFQTAGLTNDTVTGNACGTPMFMPRQQITNYKYAEPDVDVWAAAATYYNMLTGFYPKNFTGKDVFYEALYGDSVPIQKRNPRIPDKLAKVIDTALKDRPEIVIKKASDLKKAIEKAL